MLKFYIKKKYLFSICFRYYDKNFPKKKKEDIMTNCRFCGKWFCIISKTTRNSYFIFNMPPI